MVTTDNNTTYIINQHPSHQITTMPTIPKIECTDDAPDDNNTSINSTPSNYTTKMFYNLKQKRKRKLRNEPDEQSEYLEKMSVRGLDIQKYEHIVDGVAYCAVCAKKEIFKTFKNKYSFQRHAYLFHEGDNRKIFACPVCSKEFSRPDKMKMHKKDKHSEIVDMEEQMKAATEEEKPPMVAKTPVRRKRVTKAQKLLQQQQQQQQQQEYKQEYKHEEEDEIEDQQQMQSDNPTITTIIETKCESNNNGNNCTPHQMQTIDLSSMILPSQLQISTAELLQHHQQQQQQQQQQQLQNTTILYNQIDLNNALLQNQLHANNIIIQGPIGTSNGSLLPVQTIQTHDGSIFHHQPTSQQQHIQIKNDLQTITTVPLSTASTTTLSSTSTSNNSSHHQQQHHQQHNIQQHHQQHQMDMTSLTKLENVSYLPTSNENHVIGTVQSYQIITPDGLHAYHPKLLNSNEIELCPFTSTAGGSYTFSNTSSSQSNNNNNSNNNTDHSQFMDIKNELLIKSDQFMDTSGMYHLPFSPSSMINAVSEVNNSSLLETKEIRPKKRKTTAVAKH